MQTPTPQPQPKLSPKQQTTQQIKAYLLVILGYLGWFSSYLYPNETDMKFYEYSFARGIGLIFVSAIVCYKLGLPVFIKNDKSLRLITRRNSFMAIQGCVLAFSQFYIPLPVVHTMGSSGVIFIFIIDYYLNGVKVNKKQVAGIIIGIIGLILTVNGRLIITYFNPQFSIDSQFQNYKSQSPFTLFLVSLLVVLSSALWGYGIVLTKQAKDLHPIQIVLNLGFVIYLMSAFLYCFNFYGTEEANKFTSQKFFISFLLTGLPCSVSAFCHILAIKMVKNTGTIFILSFTNVIQGYLMSVFVYKESQNPICVIGIVLILIGVYKTIFQRDPQ